MTLLFHDALHLVRTPPMQWMHSTRMHGQDGGGGQRRECLYMQEFASRHSLHRAYRVTQAILLQWFFLTRLLLDEMLTLSQSTHAQSSVVVEPDPGVVFCALLERVTETK